MTSSVRGAMRHRCSCGAEYLVAVDGPSPDEDWLVKIAEVARSLDAEMIDGSTRSFVCKRCGREYVRDGDSIVVAT